MGLKDERAALFFARPVDADDDRRVRVRGGEFRPAGMPFDGGPIHGEAVHGVAARAKLLEHEILDRVLLAAQRGEPDKALREGDLLGESRLDRGGDLLA
jgi:hypothetical protein